MDNSFNGNHFLNYLWNLYYSFNSLDDWYWLFYYPIDYIVSNFNMIFNLFCIPVLNYWDYSFYYLFHLDNLWYLNHSVNNLLNNHWNFFDNFNNFFSWDYFLYNNLNLLYFCLNTVNNFLNFNNSLYFNRSLFDSFNNLNFWHLFDHLDNSLDYLGNFNYSFNNSFDWNYLLNNIGYYCWDL